MNINTVDFNATSQIIKYLLSEFGKLSIKKVHKLTNDSYFVISATIGLMYNEKLIDIEPSENEIFISLARN